MMKSSSYFTVIMVIYIIYSISRYIWCLLWRSIHPCFVTRGFKLTKPILEPSMSRLS
ncbi:hypothetical protein Gotri_027630 [Gossypium trilobum]|uniref:Uncharacterized protein n=1 Tax=Gossypium trilobum TaxID=34281 RepID=A0A7J9FRX0_9ROSI|nr:hypothetical protein [Gossypium trilobum]